MARIFTKELLLNPNTDSFKKSINDMRYNAASENRKQWATGIYDVAKSLGDVGKAFYENKQRQDRLASVDDTDLEYRNDPVWIAAKDEYARTGDSSTLNTVKSQFVAQEQAKANMALVQEERDKRLAGVKAKLAGLAKQIENSDLTTVAKLDYITQYNTLAAENSLPEYSEKTDKKAAKNVLPESSEKTDKNADGNSLPSQDAEPSDAPSETEPLTLSKIENIINTSQDQTDDGEFTTADIDVLIGRVKANTNNSDSDKKPMLASLKDAKEKLEKQENEKRITGLKNEKDKLINEKPTDTSYNNLGGVKRWNEKAKAFNNTLGEHIHEVGLITLLKVPQKPEEQASWDDVYTWLKNKFPKQIKQYKGVYNDAKENKKSDDKAFKEALKVFIDENWSAIREKYNGTHQSKKYMGNAYGR